MAFDIKMPIQIPDPATVAKSKIGPGYSIPENQKNENGIYYPNITLKSDDDSGEIDVTWMGTPVLFPIRFLGEGMDKPYRIYKPSGELQEVKMSTFNLPAATVSDFSRAKNIVTTDVLGGNGTVKELFGFDDWQIRLRGICITDPARQNSKTAQEQKEALMQWENIAGSIKVEGMLFQEKHINEIVIQSINIRQLEGKPWAIPFEINAISNEPVSLIEN